MTNYPPPPPPQPGPPYSVDPRYQREVVREQARMQRDAIRAQREMQRAQMRGLRQGSLVGPLLVIAVGVVFLLVQLGRLPKLLLWDWYGRWWPLLLIGIGVIRLAEWGFDQAMQRDLPISGPRPRRVLGGGVVALLVLLAGTGVTLGLLRGHGNDFFANGFSINPDNIDEFLGDKHESDQTVSHACPEDSMVFVQNPRGDVSIAGTSEDGQIHVTAHKEVYTRSDSDAEHKAAELAPRIDVGENRVMVTVPTVEGARADLTITVPAMAMLTVNANRGDVQVSSVKTMVAVTANHGDVTLSGIRGAISGHINNGGSSFAAHSITGQISIEGRGKDVTLSDLSGPVTMSGDFFGTTHLEHIRGPIRFHTSRTDFQLARLAGEMEISPNADLSADQVGGPAVLNTRNRNITLERVSGDLTVTNHNGSIELTLAPPMGNITVENRNGSVNVTAPSDAGFMVQAETANGEVENEFALPSGGGENHPTLSGTVNRGGPLVRVTTSQGDISLKKASIAPLPPPPPEPPTFTLRPDHEGRRHIVEGAAEATRQAEQELKSAEEEIRRANGEAAGAQLEAQKRLAEAEKALDRASRQMKDRSKEQ